MSLPHRLALLPHRGVLAVEGADRVVFLNGLLSNEVAKAEAGKVLWAALLTPQGKFLHDVFLFTAGETLLLEGESERLEDLKTRLSRYKLRAKVALALRPDLAVVAAFGGDSLPDTVPSTALTAADPRLPDAGMRLLVPADQAATLATAPLEDYEAHRLALGLPDGSRDLVVEKSMLMDSGFEELHGIDFKKGCYVGQELTARMKYRALVKKRLLPVRIEGLPPASGTPITTEEGQEAGELRSASGGAGLGLALLRLEYLNKAPLHCGEARVTPQVPAWVKLPA